MIPARCTYARLAALNDYTAPFHALRDVLTAADITIGTLDSTISNAARPIGCTPTFNLASPAAAGAGLAYAGYDVMSHAANHIRDCGAINCGDDSLFETLYFLRGYGIMPAGSGATLDAARAPAIIERNGMTFAFLAYDDIASYYHATETQPGSAPLDALTLGEDIAHAGTIADVVIVLPHWGVEYETSPSPRQREIARIAADAGATLIVGNHPHVVQAHEQLGEAFVAYALGNFVFDQDWSLATQQGAMLEVTFTGDKLTAWRYLPIHIHDQYQPRLAEPGEAAAIIARIEAASRSLE